jgi:ketosteroid isomerase-like protein
MFEIAPGECQMPVKQKGYVVMNAEEAAVRRFYEAFAAKDWETARGCFTEDAVWHLPGRSPIAGDHRGWDAIMRDFFAKVAALSGGTFRAELVDVLVGSHRVAAFQHATAERAGRKLDVTACQVMSFRDGLIADVRGHYSDQYQLDEFWS